MLVVKFILISSIFAFAVNGRILMDDINVEANPDYLSIKANVDKSGPDPVVNVDVDLKKDVEEMKIRVSLSAKLGGEFKQISPVKSFNPCKDAVEDEFVKYAMDQIEHYGNLTIACPTKAGHYVVRNFKMDDHSKSQSFGKGEFRVDVKANSIIDGKEIEAMTLGFAFHCE